MDSLKVTLDALMHPRFPVVVEKLVQRLFNVRPTLVGKPRNPGQSGFRNSPSRLPVVEYQQQVGTVLLGCEVHRVGQVVGNVELHVRQGGHDQSHSNW